jgi:pimeloyl-ACP methyl ester carboxylesterase
MREELTFTSGGERCAAWLYRPEGAVEAVPCVVMAHGFSLTRSDGLPIIAERFREAGLAVLLFDYRYFGDSSGEPRQRLRQPEQREDVRNAWAHAGGLEGIEPSKRILWGYSMGGGHVARLLGRRAIEPAASLALAPFTDGLKRVLATPPMATMRILPRALADSAGFHNTIAATAEPGELGAMAFPDEARGFERGVDPDGGWVNEVSPGVLTTLALHRPWVRASRIQCPLWVGLGERDISVDADGVRRLAGRAPAGQLQSYDADHVDLLVRPTVEAVAADQLRFLASLGLVPSQAA